MASKRSAETARCWRCKRVRSVDFLVGKKQASGRTAWRCRARSVCATKARRLKAAKKQASEVS